MKKLINTSFVYAIFAMASGVFYRTMGQISGYTGDTTLSVLHTHSFMLGMFFFIIVLSLDKLFNISSHKNFNKFYLIYNLGVIVTIIMLLARGLTQTFSINISKGLDASIMGLSGIGHIILSFGIVLFFTILQKSISSSKS
ncbi:MAG: DUF2871 domain-containing protein [Oscillospiraceae bacterium]